MFTFLLILLILDARILIPVVLLQAGKGGGLAAMAGGAGTDTLFGGRHATTLLTKLSWYCGGAFLLLAFALSILSSRPAGSDSILQREFQRGGRPAAPAPANGGAQAPATGTAPATGAAPTPSGAAPATGTGTAPAAGTAPATPAPATPAPAQP